jgi:S-adenosylmethionine:tRNA ribosyltransferase-isomerase
MTLDRFDYHLPPDLIAQYPARRRVDSRMLVVHRAAGRIEDSEFRRLPEYLKRGDVLALNNSRVIPARLFGRRLGVRSQPIGRRHPARGEYLTTQIEALLVRSLDDRTWEALVRPGRKVRTGERLIFEPVAGRGGKTRLEAEVIGRGEFGLRTLRFTDAASLTRKIERIGHVPLPPYIRRQDDRSDRLRYQTVYSRERGSVAAPTAGLHFTRAMLTNLAAMGVARAEVTLHVSLGTFQPIHEAEFQGHRLHPESYHVSANAAGRLNEALTEGRRIVAVGTTTVRTLEHVAAKHGGRLAAGSGETELFIRPSFGFRVTGAMLTNFHLPRTTLLMLVCAFAGRELTLDAYQHAVRQQYRFYSYGDCMLIL